MATAKKETQEEALETTVKTMPANAGNEPAYSVEELVQASETFGTTPDIIRAAFTVAGKTEAAEKEAKQLIDRFKKKEVK